MERLLGREVPIIFHNEGLRRSNSSSKMQLVMGLDWCSRYDSEGEEFLDCYITKRKANNEDAMRNALRNLVISDDTEDTHQYYHIDTPNTQVSMT